MTVTSTQLISRLRTWLLIAGLSALMITIGAMLGGSFLWIFVALAVGFNLAGYFYSDRIALRAARARPLEPAEAPELFEVVAQLSRRAGIPTPRLYRMPGAQPNAFATGRDPQHAAVALTDGLLATMSLGQVRAVVAHELGHIRNHDILVSSLAATMAAAIVASVNVLQMSFLFGGEDNDDNPLGIVGALAAMILAPVAGTLLQLGISRQREYLADATAAELLGSGEPLAEALSTIEHTNAPALAINPATAPMYITNPLAAGNVARLFSTHPPMQERIRRLRAYDAPHNTRRPQDRELTLA